MGRCRLNDARDVVSGEGLILIKVATGISARSSVVVGQCIRGVVWVWRWKCSVEQVLQLRQISRRVLIVGMEAVGAPQR